MGQAPVLSLEIQAHCRHQVIQTHLLLLNVIRTVGDRNLDLLKSRHERRDCKRYGVHVYVLYVCVCCGGRLHKFHIYDPILNWHTCHYICNMRCASVGVLDTVHSPFIVHMGTNHRNYLRNYLKAKQV